MIDKFRSWSYGRQHLGKKGMSLIQVLHDIIGVYSAHPTAPLSLHARVMSFSEHEFYVLDDSRMVYRVPAMRESVYMVPRETAHLAMSATLHPPSDPYWHKRYSQKGRVIPEEKYAGWKKAVIHAVLM